MTPYLFWELLFLGIGVWILALILVVYAWLLLRRQKQMIDFVVNKLEEQSFVPLRKRTTLNDLRPGADEEKSIAISKDEPIAKYADMTISDSVNVSFVEPSKNEE